MNLPQDVNFLNYYKYLQVTFRSANPAFGISISAHWLSFIVLISKVLSRSRHYNSKQWSVKCHKEVLVVVPAQKINLK